MNSKHNIDKKSTGFTTPQGYFDSFEGRLFEKMSLENSKESSALPKNTGFTTPENYFDSLEKSILSNTISQNKGRLIPLWFNRIAKVAAVLLIMITGYGIFSVSETKSIEENSFSGISEADLELYIETHIFPYSEMRSLFLSENEFELAETYLSELNQEAIYNYLDYELDDIDLLND